YNRFGRADTLTVLAKYAQIERLLQIELSLPHWLRPQQTFKARIGAIDNDTDAYRETGVSTGADITRRFGKTSYFTYGATLKYGRTVEKMAAADVIKKEGQDLVTLIGLAAFFLDRSNNPLNPTQGWRLDSRLEPTVTLDGSGQAYVKAQAQATGYLPFGEKASTVIAGRVKVGSITGVKDV
ncbi:BamA/TamA family outer membrane protein, partial [Motilimonas pumila]